MPLTSPLGSPSDRLLCGGAIGAGRLGLRLWEEEEGAESSGVLVRSCPAADALAVGTTGGGGALRVGVGGGVRTDDLSEGIVADLCLCSCRSLALCCLFLNASRALCRV